MSDLTTVSLDGKSYELVWGNLARVRYSGIPYETRAAVGVVPVATMLWSAIAQKPNPVPTWEHLAEHITPENMGELSEKLDSVLPKPKDEAKNGSAESGPLPDSPSA